MSQVAEIIKGYIATKFCQDRNPTDLGFETHLIEKDIIDSLGIFELVSFLIERFNITIEPEDVVLENFETVQAIARLVSGKLGES